MVILCAHAGADRHEANSLESIDYMLAGAAPLFEVDVRRWTDGNLYLSHNKPANGIEAARAVTLAAVFTCLRQARKNGQNICVNCDLKDDGLIPDVVALARGCGVEEALYCAGNADLSALKSPGQDPSDAKPRLEPTHLFYNIENELPDFYTATDAAAIASRLSALDAVRLRAAGIRTLNLNWRFCTDDVRRFCRREQLSLALWTIDDPDVYRRFRSYPEVTHITSNHPAAFALIP